MIFNNVAIHHHVQVLQTMDVVLWRFLIEIPLINVNKRIPNLGLSSKRLEFNEISNQKYFNQLKWRKLKRQLASGLNRYK